MMRRVWKGAPIAIAIATAAFPAYGELACPEARNSEEARTFAREHFGAAQEAYDQGRPLASLDHYQCSYRQVPHPDTLYNIGVLAEGIGQLETARDAYREYLQRFPDSEARADIQARLNRVEERIPDEPEPRPQPEPNPQAQPEPNPQAQPPEPPMPLQPIRFQPQPQQLQALQPEPQPQPSVEQPQPQPVQPIPQPVPRPRRTAGRVIAIITMPAGLVLSAFGGGLYAAAVSRNDTFQSDLEWGLVDREWLEEEAAAGRALEVAGWVMMSLGLATVVTSIVLFAVVPGRRQAERSSSSHRGFNAVAAPLILEDGLVGLSMSGRF